MANLVDARRVAEELCVSRDFVYAHANELGVIRLGNGPRPRLRFDLDVVRERYPHWNPARPPGSPVQPWENEHARDLVARRRAAHRSPDVTASGVELLPIKGRRSS